jgi:hypothetical protein
MSTTQTIDYHEARELLRNTSRVNRSHMIGTPHAGRYTLPEALGELDRCRGVFQVETQNGLSILKAMSSEGLHRWYVQTEDDRMPLSQGDPWEMRY